MKRGILGALVAIGLLAGCVGNTPGPGRGASAGGADLVQKSPTIPVCSSCSVDYTVYFEFDKDTLTESGRLVVKMLLADARMVPLSSITLIGHTDTVGSADYNLALGLRRANRVRDALIAGGIPADRITVASKGMIDLKVATGPDVPEIRNRRVEMIPEL
jgi:outer membrane protein OmpA-like peptidoglycan-associated protein